MIGIIIIASLLVAGILSCTLYAMNSLFELVHGRSNSA